MHCCVFTLFRVLAAVAIAHYNIMHILNSILIYLKQLYNCDTFPIQSTNLIGSALIHYRTFKKMYLKYH